MVESRLVKSQMVASLPARRRLVEATAGLLDATNETELEEAVGGLVADSARSVGGRLSERSGRALTRALTAIAARTLPTFRQTAIHADTLAAQVFGLELEGMSSEDRDYEIARQLTRLIRAAAVSTARTSGSVDPEKAIASAARRFGPGLEPNPHCGSAALSEPAEPFGFRSFRQSTPDRKGRPMFDVRAQQTEYGQAEYFGQRRRSRSRWGQGEGEQFGEGGFGEYGEGEGEGPYGEAEGGYQEYGEAEGEYGEYGEYGEGEGSYGGEAEGQYEHYGEAQEQYGEYGEGESQDREYGEYGQGEGQYEQDREGEGEQYGESEERFLPLIPIVGKVLGGLLGGLIKEAEYGEGEFNEGEGESAAGEAEEQFLHKIFAKVLGQEAEQAEMALSPAQEARFAAELMEVANEQEMEAFLGRIINTVGRAVQGIQGAANSPQGRALINIVKPLAKAALPAIGGPVGAIAGALLEAESPEMEGGQQGYELARRVVRLTGAAARDVAMAPPDAPPQLVGEFGFHRATRSYARPLYRRSLRSVSPYARRYYGRRYGTFRRGYRPGYLGRRYGGGYRRYGYYGPGRQWRGYRPSGYLPPYGYPQPPVPAPEPTDSGQQQQQPAEPPNPRPGYRWVAVPIGAPDPAAATSVPGGPPPGGPDAPPAGQDGPPQSEFGYGRGPDDGGRPRYGGGNGHGQGNSGRWFRDHGKIVLIGG